MFIEIPTIRCTTYSSLDSLTYSPLMDMLLPFWGIARLKSTERFGTNAAVTPKIETKKVADIFIIFYTNIVLSFLLDLLCLDLNVKVCKKISYQHSACNNDTKVKGERKITHTHTTNLLLLSVQQHHSCNAQILPRESQACGCVSTLPQSELQSIYSVYF